MDIDKKENEPELDERYERFKELVDSWKSVMSIDIKIDIDKTDTKKEVK